jgi:rfaE bifunctional protein nucleotidyltransferase chain/domain
MTKQSSGRILGLRELKKEVARLKKSGKKVVFANGCFDIMHVGHVRLFKKARSAGDALIVAVNADKTVRKLKGKGRPVVRAEHRKEILSSIRYIDYVTEFAQDTPLEMIRELKPDIIVKGADWAYDKVVGREYARVIRIPLVGGMSTSGIIKKIKEVL